MDGVHARFDHVDVDTVNAVLEASNYDFDKAAETLNEMQAQRVALESERAATSPPPPSRLPEIVQRARALQQAGGYSWLSLDIVVDVLEQCDGDLDRAELQLLALLPDEEQNCDQRERVLHRLATRPYAPSAGLDAAQRDARAAAGQASGSRPAYATRAAAGAAPTARDATQLRQSAATAMARRDDMYRVARAIGGATAQQRAYIRCARQYDMVARRECDRLVELMLADENASQLDLHGLTAEHAAFVVAAKLDQMRRARDIKAVGASGSDSAASALHIVVGRGLHSRQRGGHSATVRSAVRHVLEQHGAKFSTDAHQGAFFIWPRADAVRRPQ